MLFGHKSAQIIMAEINIQDVSVESHSARELSLDFPPERVFFFYFLKNSICTRTVLCLKKNQTTPRPSEHPLVMGKKCQNVQVGSKGCKYKTTSWHLNRFPDADNIGSTV